MEMAQILAVVIFAVMFLLIVTEKIERHWVSLGCGMLMLVVVLGYQLLGTLGEWLLKGDFYMASQDFRIGIPGMLIQIFGGYLFVKYLIHK